MGIKAAYFYSKVTVYIVLNEESVIKLHACIGDTDVIVIDKRGGANPNMQVINSYKIKERK